MALLGNTFVDIHARRTGGNAAGIYRTDSKGERERLMGTIKQDIAHDRAFRAGMKMGWNLGLWENSYAFEKAIDRLTEDINDATADDLDFDRRDMMTEKSDE